MLEWKDLPKQEQNREAIKNKINYISEYFCTIKA